MRQLVMQTAWKIFQATQISFSKALKAAWLVVKGTASFSFYKVDGEKRTTNAEKITLDKRIAGMLLFVENGEFKRAKIANLI